MKVGSTVETKADFSEERTTWGLPYPKKGDLLTISYMQPHHNPHARRLGIVLLKFEELPNLIPISHKTIHNKINFVEVLPPMNMQEAVDEVLSERLQPEPLVHHLV